MARTGPRVTLLGAPGDTGNLGVSALLHATLAALHQRVGNIEITVCDNGLGTRHGATTDAAGRTWPHRLVGLRLSRRVYRPESLAAVRIAARLGGCGNAAAQALRSADVVLALNGGDSFSDLYGTWRFRSVALPQLLALRQRRPLVLLPQTYGPFAGASVRRTAADITGRAQMAWARDAQSFDELRALLGDRFDAARHRHGVDVAFRLPATPPAGALPERLQLWLDPRRDRPVVGLNVSGLLYHDATTTSRYGLVDAYRGTVGVLMERLLQETPANLVLVPHVLGAGESDALAIADVLARLTARDRSRVQAAPALRHPGEAKWLIGSVDWFCGTRMHATIAALSSGVPVVGIAYSMKARGVFASCGLADEVVDARELGAGALADRVMSGWHRRHEVADTLQRHLPGTLARADAQMDAVADWVVARAEAAGASRGRVGA